MPWKKIFAFLKSTLIISVITVGLAEVALRIYEISTPTLQNKKKLDIYNPTAEKNGLLLHKKNLNISLGVENRAVKFKTNSDGFCWYEFPKHKDSSKKRILFIGDSFTAGMWADSFEVSFVGISNKYLSTEHYEVINLGVSGYGFADYAQMIKYYAPVLQADEIVICTFNGNDFRDTEKGLLTKAKVDEPNGHEDQSWKTRILNKTALYRNFSRIGNVIKVNNLKKQNPIFETLKPGDDLSYIRWSDTVFCKKNRQTQDSVFARMREIHTFCAQQGIKLRIVSIPYDYQVYSKNLQLNNFNFHYPQAYIKDECSRLGISFLDLMTPLRNIVQKEQKRIYCIWDAHFNTLGHKIAGEEISRWILGR